MAGLQLCSGTSKAKQRSGNTLSLGQNHKITNQLHCWATLIQSMQKPAHIKFTGIEQDLCWSLSYLSLSGTELLWTAAKLTEYLQRRRLNWERFGQQTFRYTEEYCTGCPERNSIYWEISLFRDDIASGH